MEDNNINKQFNSPVMDKVNDNPLNKYQNIQNSVQKEVNQVKELRGNSQTNGKDRFEDTVIEKEKKKNIVFRMLDKLFPQKTGTKITKNR